jgi:hypothetical protein
MTNGPGSDPLSRFLLLLWWENQRLNEKSEVTNARLMGSETVLELISMLD